MNDVATKSEPSKQARYHGLDALRAWAMSMGIVLHAAWIMIPGDAGAPKTDSDAAVVPEFICLSIHTFRMQLFFVLAGLFACLLVRKRGWYKFSLNRFMRIGVPLVLFWVILCPIMVYQYNLAGIQSGAIQGESGAWELTKEFFLALSPQSAMLVHLWFIYYLCLTYLLVLAARGIVIALDPREKFRNWISDAAGRLLTSPWSAFILAIAFAPWLLSMKTVWGIEIDAISLYPKWSGLLSYVLYFCVGWLIYRNIDKLSQIVSAWRWQLALGCLLLVPYFFYAKFAQHNGYATWDYPRLAVEDLSYDHARGRPDYSSFRQKLLNAEEDSIARKLWDELPVSYQRFIEEHGNVSANQIAGIFKQINLGVLPTPNLTDSIEAQPQSLSARGKELLDIPGADRTPEENEYLNREILEAGFSGILLTEDIHRPFYWLQRTAYAYGYSVISWLLILGCIGFSLSFFQRESRFWRYFSDSSYWMYLGHLPIQFGLLVWFGDETWHWTIKFSAYVVVTLALLIPSYHLLVRPTWLGWLLNGRRYRTQLSQETSPAATGKPATT